MPSYLVLHPLVDKVVVVAFVLDHYTFLFQPFLQFKIFDIASPHFLISEMGYGYYIKS